MLTIYFLLSLVRFAPKLRMSSFSSYSIYIVVSCCLCYFTPPEKILKNKGANRILATTC